MLLPVVLSFLLISACSFSISDPNKKSYNELSRQHNEIANQAIIKKDEAVDEYNDGNYEESKEAARSAKSLFSDAKEISERNRLNAIKITDLYWLKGYQEKVIQSEIYWMDLMDIVIEACDAQIAGDMTKANNLVTELKTKSAEYEKLQQEIEQIEEEHKDFFEG